MSDNEHPNIAVHKNKVWFYADIDDNSILRLITTLHEMDELEHPEINLFLFSGGGDTFAALAAVDEMALLNTPIHTVIEGYAGSAASLIAMAGNRRYITQNGYMLLHATKSEMSGNLWEQRDELKMSEMLTGHLISFYERRTHLQDSDIEALLKRESWLNAGQCIELGLVDTIYSKRKEIG